MELRFDFYIGATPEHVWHVLTSEEGVKHTFFGSVIRSTFRSGTISLMSVPEMMATKLSMCTARFCRLSRSKPSASWNIPALRTTPTTPSFNRALLSNWSLLADARG